MKPGVFNKICAYPGGIAFGMGGLFLDGLIGFLFWKHVLMEGVLHDAVALAYFIFSMIPGFLLGGFTGVAAFHSPILDWCTKINGGPYEVGDEVMVLIGPHQGRCTQVYELSRGQGGEWLPRVDLGDEEKKACGDLFSACGLFRVARK